MKILVGNRYQDGWGEWHTIVGPVEDKLDQFWSDTGYRWLEDGRMQMRVVPDRTKFDLVELELVVSSAQVAEQQPERLEPSNHTV